MHIFMSWGTSTQISLAGICLVMNLCKYVMNIHCLRQIKNYYLVALETWVLRKLDIKSINAFEMKCYRRILQ